jgi:hypothetical protein
MQELKIEETIEKLKDMIIDFGDGLLEFETRDVTVLLNQLTLQENYNDMLVTELEDLKAEKEKMKVGLFARSQAIQELEKEAMERRADNEYLEKENDNLMGALSKHEALIFSLEQQIERNRKYHNGTLLQLGKAKQVIDLMKIMLIGAEKQDFVIYPSSDKTPNYLDIIANKIAEYEK